MLRKLPLIVITAATIVFFVALCSLPAGAQKPTAAVASALNMRGAPWTFAVTR